jgi:hypothetical protein
VVAIGLPGISAPSLARVVLIALAAVAYPCVVLFTTLMLAILVHELGHLVAGLRAGFEFRSLSIGPFEVAPEGGRLKWARAPRFRGVAVQVRMKPRDYPDLDRRMVGFIAGGPLASILFCLVSYGFWVATLPFREKGASLGLFAIYLFALCLFLMSLSLLPGTLVPYTTRSGHATDMRLLMTLWGKGGEKERLLALLVLTGEIFGNVRARDWSSGPLERARASGDGSLNHLRILTLLYYHRLDQGDVPAARTVLSEALPFVEKLKKGNMVREQVWLESSYVAAWFDQDVTTAERYLAEAGEEIELLASVRARVRAAIALRKGDRTTAKAQADLAEELLRKYIARYGGNPGLDLDLIEEIRRESA